MEARVSTRASEKRIQLRSNKNPRPLTRVFHNRLSELDSNGKDRRSRDAMGNLRRVGTV
jgi:hypothetical protein